jgi:hypothetical protein
MRRGSIRRHQSADPNQRPAHCHGQLTPRKPRVSGDGVGRGGRDLSLSPTMALSREAGEIGRAVGQILRARLGRGQPNTSSSMDAFKASAIARICGWRRIDVTGGAKPRRWHRGSDDLRIAPRLTDSARAGCTRHVGTGERKSGEYERFEQLPSRLVVAARSTPRSARSSGQTTLPTCADTRRLRRLRVRGARSAG